METEAETNLMNSTDTADSDNQTMCMHNSYNYSQYIIIIYLGSPIAILGIFSNILLAVLFGGRHNCGTTNIYFSVLAFLDIGICALYVMLFAVDALALYNEIHPLWEVWMIYVLPFLALSKIIQLTSTYIVVLATVERFFIVANCKLISRSFCTPRKRQAIIAILILTITMLRLPTYWEYKLIERPDCVGVDQFSTIQIDLLLMGNAFYKEVYNFYMMHVIQVFVPITSLVVLNAIIVYQLRRQLSLAKRFVCLFPEKCVSQQVIETGLSKDKVRKATYTLVAIVTSYLVCNSVNLLLSIMEYISKKPYLEDEYGVPTDLYNYLTESVSFLLCSIQQLGCSFIRPVMKHSENKLCPYFLDINGKYQRQVQKMAQDRAIKMSTTKTRFPYLYYTKGIRTIMMCVEKLFFKFVFVW